jgi:hypothetical protein
MDGQKIFSERGYVVKETGNVYFTMEKEETYKNITNNLSKWGTSVRMTD